MLIGDMNEKAENSEVADGMGKWSMDGVNENGEYLVDRWVERGLLLANIFFHQGKNVQCIKVVTNC